jgi:amino acid permease
VQVNVFSIYQELHNPTAARINKIGYRSCMMSCFLYAMIGAFGFMRFSNLKFDWSKANGNILNNYALSYGSNGANCTGLNCWATTSFDQLLKSPSIVIGEAAITVTILLAFPLNVFPCRYTIEMMMDAHGPDQQVLKESPTGEDLASPHSVTASQGLLDGEEKVEDEPKPGCGARHFFLTFLIVGLAMALAMFLPNIQIVFGLLGSTTSAFVCYIVPAMFVLKIEEGPWYSRQKLPATILMVGGAVTGVVCTGVIVYTTFLQQ